MAAYIYSVHRSHPTLWLASLTVWMVQCSVWRGRGRTKGEGGAARNVHMRSALQGSMQVAYRISITACCIHTTRLEGA